VPGLENVVAAFIPIGWAAYFLEDPEFVGTVSTARLAAHEPVSFEVRPLSRWVRVSVREEPLRCGHEGLVGDDFSRLTFSDVTLVFEGHGQILL
jgi:hypothetical protein